MGLRRALFVLVFFLLVKLLFGGDFKVVIILVIYEHMITREIVCID